MECSLKCQLHLLHIWVNWDKTCISLHSDITIHISAFYHHCGKDGSPGKMHLAEVFKGILAKWKALLISLRCIGIHSQSYWLILKLLYRFDNLFSLSLSTKYIPINMVASKVVCRDIDSSKYFRKFKLLFQFIHHSYMSVPNIKPWLLLHLFMSLCIDEYQRHNNTLQTMISWFLLCDGYPNGISCAVVY